MNHDQRNSILLALSLLVFLFYLTVVVLLKDVYEYPALGAIYELLSLPLVLMLAGIPVLVAYFYFRYREARSWKALAALLLIVCTILLLVKSVPD